MIRTPCSVLDIVGVAAQKCNWCHTPWPSGPHSACLASPSLMVPPCLPPSPHPPPLGLIYSGLQLANKVVSPTYIPSTPAIDGVCLGPRRPFGLAHRTQHGEVGLLCVLNWSDGTHMRPSKVLSDPGGS